MGAGDRLFDEDRAGDQPLELRRRLHAPPQIEQRLDVVVLLVAVERGEIRLGARIEYRRDLAQPLQIGGHIAADLKLEIAVAVGGHHLFQRFRQSVADLAGMTGDDVDQPNRVPCGDCFGGRELREKAGRIEAREIG